MRPRLLDLFCCAGGAAMGYHRAGFDVVGVDINPQPRYPFEFHQGDALEYFAEHGHEFDVIHASPPCQDHSALNSVTEDHGTAWLLDATRQALLESGRPYVIENVMGAPMVDPMILCGTQFMLGTHTEQRGLVWLRRHRQFESSMFLWPPGPCSCAGANIIGVYGHGDGGGRGWKGHFADRKRVMGIDWMTRDELSQSIPPAYTEWIGHQLMEALVPA